MRSQDPLLPGLRCPCLAKHSQVVPNRQAVVICIDFESGNCGGLIAINRKELLHLPDYATELWSCACLLIDMNAKDRFSSFCAFV